jgi:hemolysin III
VGWWLLGAEIALALVGIALIAARRDARYPNHARAHEVVRLVLYLVMGWLVVAFAGPVFQTLTPGAAFWLVAGGVAYSVGAVVFATDRPHLWPGRFSAHDLWHLFVLAGSGAHVAFVLGYVLRGG